MILHSKKVLTRHHKTQRIFLAENAPLPQLDRGTDYESVRRGFESLTAHHLKLQAATSLAAFFIAELLEPELIGHYHQRDHVAPVSSTASFQQERNNRHEWISGPTETQ